MMSVAVMSRREALIVSRSQTKRFVALSSRNRNREMASEFASILGVKKFDFALTLLTEQNT